MKKIHTYEEMLKHHEENCGKCHVLIRNGVYEVTCDKCIDKKVVKKTKKEFIKEIDADGNGHITKKEVNDYFGKDDK